MSAPDGHVSVPCALSSSEGAVGEGEAGQALPGEARWTAAGAEEGEVTTLWQQGSWGHSKVLLVINRCRPSLGLS